MIKMRENSLIVAPFLKCADSAAREYVSSNGEKTYYGLREHISKSLSDLDQLSDSPLSSRVRRDIINMVVKDYKDKLKVI